MSRYILKGKEPGSEVAVGLDNPLQHWFLQYYPKGVDYEPPEDSEEEEGPTVWKDTRSNYEMLDFMEEFCDMEHSLFKQVRERISGDFDPHPVVGITHYKRVP